MIDQHWLTTLRNILKTHQGSPQSVILFLSGNLQGKAQLHLKQLNKLSMITRLPSDHLHSRAKHVLTSGFSSCKSWFFQVRDICVLYNLPHPLQLLSNPIPKHQFRKLTRSRVTDYWETRLRQEAALLPSLTYFKPQFHSLSTPHPLLWTPGPNSHEVSKSLVQLRMLSGRYRVAKLTRHWSPTNRSGCCPAPLCPDLETLEHLLIDCSYYHQLRARLKKAWYKTTNPKLYLILSAILSSSTQDLVQFLLDPSVHPSVIALVQSEGQGPLRLIFHLTRTWCYSVHRERLRLLNSFRFD